MKKLPYESGFFTKINRKATNMERLSYFCLLLLMQQTKWHKYSFAPLDGTDIWSGPWTKCIDCMRTACSEAEVRISLSDATIIVPRN